MFLLKQLLLIFQQAGSTADRLLLLICSLCMWSIHTNAWYIFELISIHSSSPLQSLFSNWLINGSKEKKEKKRFIIGFKIFLNKLPVGAASSLVGREVIYEPEGEQLDPQLILKDSCLKCEGFILFFVIGYD